ncbi:DEAD/DEAH box helicase [Marinobacter sp. DUT-3]|uniref:DEAD/DEAH box helicase n=1 Tax=Marinobacter sp. DUT-3 TaxID=3412036 RepID=UPI003D172BCE
MDSSRNLIKYFRDCLSKEGFDQPLTDVFAASQRDHLVSPGFYHPHSAWPEVGKCTLEELGLYRNKYDGFRRAARDEGKEEGALMLGIFPVVIIGGDGGDIRAPLLIAPIDDVLRKYARFPKLVQEPFDFKLLRYNPEVTRHLPFDLPALNWMPGTNVLEVIESRLEAGLGKEAQPESLFHCPEKLKAERLSIFSEFRLTWLAKAVETGWMCGTMFWLPNDSEGDLAIRDWNKVHETNVYIHYVIKYASKWRSHSFLTFSTLGFQYGDISTLASTQSLKGQDYQLMLGLYPIAASVVDEEGQTQRIRAPLLQLPIDWSEGQLQQAHELYETPISVEQLEYNPAVLDLFDDPLPELDFSNDLRCLERIEEFLQQKFSPPGLDIEQWCSNGISRKLLRDGNVHWGKFSFCWFSRRSRMERSVMHELSLLAESDMPLSAPLLQILGSEQQLARQSISTPNRLPSPLTNAQELALVNGATELLSVINGPPGTGKTHTLACQAFDRVINGESVLIVCANDHAADVVRDKVTALFGGSSGLVMRPGRGDYKKEFLEKLDRWLARGDSKPDSLGGRGNPLLNEPGDDLLRQANSNFSRALARAEKGGLSAQGLRAWCYRKWIVHDDLLSNYWEEALRQLARHQKVTERFLKATLRARLSRLLRAHRSELGELSKVARSRSSYHRNRHMESVNWHLMTSVLPVWVVSAGSLNETVPLAKDLFDLVIIDEATQCNLPLALPALQRGRRAVVVGDPQQLRHFSFVSREWQSQKAAEHRVTYLGVDLDYRSRSLLDYAMTAIKRQDAVGFLDEHFRSHPNLIGFSNDRYYNSRIQILTHHKSELVEQPFRHVDCELALEGKLNLAEMDAVMRELADLLEAYAEAEIYPSIGVMAMQRRAALELEKRILEEVSLKNIGRFRLRVATPFGFQGEERDIILMATCLWPGQSDSARRFMGRDDVLNVAVTRARHQQILFYPKAVLAESGHSAIHEYIRYARKVEQTRSPVQQDPTDSVRRELRVWLAGLGVKCQSDYPFAGQCIDLVAFVESRRVAIDLVGAESGSGVEQAWAIDRYRLLERAGMKLFPLAAVHWHKRKNKVKEELRSCLGLSGRVLDPVSVASLDADLYQRLLGLPPLRDEESKSNISLASLYKELSKNNNLASFWIQQHFQPGEISFQRYEASRDALYTAAEAELSGLCLLMESARDMDSLDILTPEIQRRYTGCRDAVAALTQLATRLAVLRGDTQLDQALADVGRLTERVALYERE